MRYFSDCKSMDDVKTMYRDLCKKYHPDLGGDEEIMKAINAEYERVIAEGLKGQENFEAKMDVERELMEMVQRFVVLQGLIVEVCGRWIWLTGNTFSVKDQLKALGCFFAAKKKAWYWHSPDEKCVSKRKLSLEEIRAKYGSIAFAGKERKAIA